MDPVQGTGSDKVQGNGSPAMGQPSVNLRSEVGRGSRNAMPRSAASWRARASSKRVRTEEAAAATGTAVAAGRSSARDARARGWGRWRRRRDVRRPSYAHAVRDGRARNPAPSSPHARSAHASRPTPRAPAARSGTAEAATARRCAGSNADGGGCGGSRRRRVSGRMRVTQFRFLQKKRKTLLICPSSPRRREVLYNSRRLVIHV